MTAEEEQGNSPEGCTALCLEMNTDKASGRQDTEDDEHGEKSGKVRSRESSRHARNLGCTRGQMAVGKGWEWLFISIPGPISGGSRNF